jgi:hypothetical protein
MTLLIPASNHGIDLHRAAGGEPASQQRDNEKHYYGRREGIEIGCRDLSLPKTPFARTTRRRVAFTPRDNRICLRLLSLNVFADTLGKGYARKVSDRCFLSGGSFVAMVQAADLRDRDDRSHPNGLDRSADRRVLAER